MSKSWEAFAQHVLDSIARIEKIVERGDLSEDFVLYDAVLRNLQTLSEATQHLPDNLTSLSPSIPWREISGFRNILVHNYLGNIDPMTIATVVDNHLGPLEKAIREMLAAHGKSRS